MTVPTCYTLTGLTRAAGANRRVVIQGFDLPFRGVLVAAAAFAIGLVPTVLAVLLSSWGLLVMAGRPGGGVPAGGAPHPQRAAPSDLPGAAGPAAGNRTVGRFRCCGVTVDPAPRGVPHHHHLERPGHRGDHRDAAGTGRSASPVRTSARTRRAG